MTTKSTFIIYVFALFLISCASQKKVENENLYHTTWELEYITGPRISFNGLYPDKKPEISFNKATHEVSGNNSCNGYTANYNLTGNSISFDEPKITTMMYCGEGEEVFLNAMKEINKYGFDQDGKLKLMLDDVVMMRFKITENQ